MMVATLTGIFSGLLIIGILALLKQLDKFQVLGLELAAIGFLYVGFSWTNLTAVIINAVQAIVFLFIAYYGVKKNGYILAAGYFLHGAWDMLYNLFPLEESIPPHYDWFCFSIDFTTGIYLVWLNSRRNRLRLAISKDRFEWKALSNK